MAKPHDIIADLIEHSRAGRTKTIELAGGATAQASGQGSVQVIRPVGIPSEEQVGGPQLITYPDILFQAVVTFRNETTEGSLVESVSIAWFEIVKQLEQDPGFLFKIDWRRLEEIIAGAYERAGWPEVILTPRSGDGGRDVIATKPGSGSIRIIDQVKAYKRGHLVTADEVRSVLGVLEVDQNVSKGVITTTSKFAPGIFKDQQLQKFVPYRLELKDGHQLSQWLRELIKKNS